MSSRLTEVIDRHGFVHARLAWTDDALVELIVPSAIIRGAVVDDPLLGRAHAIATPAGDVITTMSALDWSHPTEIPTIAAPGALPPGAGGAILNVLALLAQRAGVTELRYAGPYPTNALYATLARSFRTTTSEEDFTATFAERAARIAREPLPAVFVPAPHERLAIITTAASEPDVRGIAELRDGLERATLDGTVYARGAGITRLVASHIGEINTARDDIDHVRAEVWFAGERYAHVATFDARGELVAGPHAIPPCESDVIGKAFPPEMIAALAELVADHLPSGLAREASQVIVAHRLRWADLGARAAARAGDELHVHAALWRLAPRGMAHLAIALVEALLPIVSPLAARSLLHRH